MGGYPLLNSNDQNPPALVAGLRNMTVSGWWPGAVFRALPISRSAYAARSSRVRTIAFPECFVGSVPEAAFQARNCRDRPRQNVLRLTALCAHPAGSANLAT
jgi:hypothetical protein